jgi:enoyl-CoA hydratase/carnithine racemase
MLVVGTEDPRDVSDADLPPVLLFRIGQVGHLVVNRPVKLNAIDATMLALFRSAIAGIEANDNVRAVVLSAAGTSFCAGADLAFVRQQLESAAAFESFLGEWHETFVAIERCSKPIIAAVHGVALAGGLELTQVCDVVVAASDAQFGDQHARFGLFPGGGSTQRLPRLIGQRRALWLLLSGERFSAGEALNYGMVNRVVNPESVLTEAVAMAEQLAALSSSASAAIKRAVLEGASMPLDDALVLERAMAVHHMMGADANVGLTAFETRTQPVFNAAGSD